MVVRIDPYEPMVQHAYSTVRFGGVGSHGRADRGEPLDKQSRYWRHAARNRLIVALARRIAVAEIDDREESANPQRVAVLVETPVHGRLLAAELPGWPLVTQDSPHGELSDRSILTLSAASRHRDLRLTWLIDAMGGPPSEWLAKWLVVQAVAGQAVHVVDLTDGCSPSAAAAARARQTSLRRAHAHWRPLSKKLLKPVLDEMRDHHRR